MAHILSYLNDLVEEVPIKKNILTNKKLFV